MNKTEVEIAKRLAKCKQFVPTPGMWLIWNTGQGIRASLVVLAVNADLTLTALDVDTCLLGPLRLEEWRSKTYPNFDHWATVGCLMGLVGKKDPVSVEAALLAAELIKEWGNGGQDED